MRILKLVFFWITGLLSFCLILLNVFDAINLIKNPKTYPFESEFVTRYSIYSSEDIYMLYVLLSTIIFLLILFFAFKQKTKLVALFLVLGIIAFLYPIVTASK
jgi:uncharacterized membrane protein